MIRSMDLAINLDDLHQRLEVYDAAPAQNSDGSWSYPYYGQATVKDLDAQFKQGILCFPSDMQTAYRELVITIGGKSCWVWRESIGPEVLELAQAITTQDWLVINETGQRLQERIPAAKTALLLTEAMNWLQAHDPTTLEWFLFTEFEGKVQEHVDALLEAVIQQDSALLQKAMFAKANETLTLEQWYPRSGYADPGERLFIRAVDLVVERLLTRDPQLVRWFVDHAFIIPPEIKQQIMAKVKIFESLNSSLE